MQIERMTKLLIIFKKLLLICIHSFEYHFLWESIDFVFALYWLRQSRYLIIKGLLWQKKFPKSMKLLLSQNEGALYFNLQKSTVV